MNETTGIKDVNVTYDLAVDTFAAVIKEVGGGTEVTTCSIFVGGRPFEGPSGREEPDNIISVSDTEEPRLVVFADSGCC